MKTTEAPTLRNPSVPLAPAGACARVLALACLVGMAGCATGLGTDSPDVHASPQSAAPASAQTEVATSPWAQIPPDLKAPGAKGWEHQTFPGKAQTRFDYLKKDGRHAVVAYARASASMKRVRLHVPAESLGTVQFSWKVPALIAQADMSRRELDDSAVRVVLVFEGDRSRFSSRDAMLSELARALTGEEMPYATLMYVWSKQRAPGEVILNPRTSRIRKLVLESGPANLGRWIDYERNIRADYERAFGEPPGALLGIGIMTDTDNTGALAQAWYGPVRVLPRVRPPQGNPFADNPF